MEKHPILYEYYSKYDGGNPLNRVALAVPRVLRSTTSRLASHAKEFARDTGKIMKEGLRDNIRDNIATELFQGNNPFNSFMKNIDKRIKNSDESIYNQLYQNDLSHKIKNYNPYEISSELLTRIKTNKNVLNSLDSNAVKYKNEMEKTDETKDETKDENQKERIYEEYM
jgi:hypothetical protein